MKATFIRDVSSKFAGEARLYRLDPPVGYGCDWDTDEFKNHTQYVVSSAVGVLFSGPETYLFPADENGEVLDWMELDGSFRGDLDCDQAIRNAGYEIVEG